MAKNYFPDTYTDFSPTSPGMMFIEMASYVGDILSFYQDINIQETFVQFAKNPSNLFHLAYTMGYRPKVTSASEVILEVSQTVDAGLDGEPDWSQALYLPGNTKVQSNSKNQTTFIVQEPINFQY